MNFNHNNQNWSLCLINKVGIVVRNFYVVLPFGVLNINDGGCGGCS